MGFVVALAGGVGAARLLRGLVRVLSPDELLIVGNTGDDFEYHGLLVSPDIDIVMYTLAGIVDEEKGWGIADDTFSCLGMLEGLGFEGWFRLGDKDLAVQVVKNDLLKSRATLSEAVVKLSRMLGVKARIVPMSNFPVRTAVFSGPTRLGFQEYFVKRGARDRVTRVMYEGCEDAKPAPGIIEAINTADRVIVCPSNSVLSIGPILSVPGIRDALRTARAHIVAVSPIVGGKALKGPADRVMRSLGFEASAFGVAKLYEDFLDHIVIDEADARLRPRIESLVMGVTVTDTVMKDFQKAVSLATAVLDAE